MQHQIRVLRKMIEEHNCLLEVKGSCECEKWEKRLYELEFSGERLIEAYDFN